MKKMLYIRRVVGKSMWPILDPEQVVLVMRKRRYREEDVVVILHDGKEKIKRIREEHRGRFDMRGDNPARSTDSRHFGLIEKSDIIGKVIWPRV
ncbi:nickel-type superoxide dismutase maturation protease [Candidatus Saccharibacteria bacterium]|nr:nickel-type superoxide dismutase maturation protease [Candidatus Saccharibacteria bacterium]